MTAEARRAWSLALLAVVCAAALAAVYIVAVRTGGGQAIDDAALAGREIEPQELFSDALHALDTISVGSLAAVTLLLMALAALRRRFMLALAVGVMLFGANATTQALKRQVLERPDFITEEIAHNSFPSGHATVALSVAMAVLMVVPMRMRLPVGVLAFAASSAIGVATVATGWHRPSDVLGAWAVVGMWTAAASGFLLAARRGVVDESHARHPFIGGVTIGVGATLLGASAIALSVVRFWLTDGPLSLRQEALGFVGASLGIFGALLILMAAYLAAMRGVRLGMRRETSEAVG